MEEFACKRVYLSHIHVSEEFTIFLVSCRFNERKGLCYFTDKFSMETSLILKMGFICFLEGRQKICFSII